MGGLGFEEPVPDREQPGPGPGQPPSALTGVCVQGSNLPAKVSVSIRNDRKVIKELLLSPLEQQEDPANIICDFVSGTSLVATMKQLVETIDYDHDDWCKLALIKKVNDAMRHWSIHIA